MNFGVHLSTSKGFKVFFEEAAALQISSAQCFTASNVRWCFDHTVAESTSSSFFNEKKSFESFSLYSHAAYLINLASENEELREKSIRALIAEVFRAKQLGIKAITVHPGSNPERKKGIALIGKSLAAVYEKIPSSAPRILLEQSAGAGSTIPSTIEELGDLFTVLTREGIPAYFTLDTCHAHAAGYDFSSAVTQKKFFDVLFSVLPPEAIQVLHLNDSLYGVASKRDRHAFIGEGTIGVEGFRLLMKEERIKEVVKILETPYKTIDDYRKDLSILRSF